MRRVLTTAVLIAAMSLGAANVALAQPAPPCNDTDGDGSPSGQEYAHYHIVALARSGGMGAGGHVPGSHNGFSVCL